jgi:LacI family transcriptional regulator
VDGNEKKTVTIRDVAALADVSVATASRALSGHGYVSSEVKQRVHDAARELGYKPHALARSLRLQRTNTVGLMIADIVNPFYAYLADGVLDCAKPLGYHVILCAHNEDPDMEQEYLEVLMQERADGIIAVPTGQNLSLWREVIDLGTRLVFVDREVAGISDADLVLVDNVKGAYDATVHLISLGHRRIGIITGPTSTTTGNGRLRGYCNALEEAQIPVDQDLVQIGTFMRESGRQAAHRLLSMDEPPTAIFAANNVLGEASLFVIRERGLRIPEDISLILFDDVPWASLTTPTISVVAQPEHSLGFVGMERLIRRLQETDKAENASTKTVLQPELIIRESCRAYTPPGL